MNAEISNEIWDKVTNVKKHLDVIYDRFLTQVGFPNVGNVGYRSDMFISGGIIPWLFVYHDQPNGKIETYEGDLDLYVTDSRFKEDFGIDIHSVKLKDTEFDLNPGVGVATIEHPDLLRFEIRNANAINDIISIKSAVEYNLMGTDKPTKGHLVNIQIMCNASNIHNALGEYDMQHLTSYYDTFNRGFYSSAKTLECLQRRLIMNNFLYNKPLDAYRVKKYMDRGFRIHNGIQVTEFGDMVVKQDNFAKMYAKNRSKIIANRS